MIDSYTTIVFGWKFTGDKKDKFEELIEELGYYDDNYAIFEDVFVDDTMCGEYCYFGPIVFHEDNNEDWHSSFDKIDFDRHMKNFTKWKNDNSEIWKKIEPFCKSESHIYIFNQMS